MQLLFKDSGLDLLFKIIVGTSCRLWKFAPGREWKRVLLYRVRYCFKKVSDLRLGKLHNALSL